MSKVIRDYFLMIAGSILSSIAICAFLLPSNIGIGGVTGIALVLNKLFGFKLGLSSLLMNIPLFVFGYKILGRRFIFRSGFVVFSSSVLIDFINAAYRFEPMNDMLLATIFCGVLFGISVALIFMGGGSTGGLDILAKLIVTKSEGIQISNVLLIQDVLVYLVVAYAIGIRSVMYALVMSFVRTKSIDTLQEGISSSKQCIIICENSANIINEIQTKLERGVTILDAVGGFSNNNKKFIYVVIQKSQLNLLRTIVKNIEPDAFVAVSSVSDILGNYRQGISV